MHACLVALFSALLRNARKGTHYCACLQQVWEALGEDKYQESLDMCNLGLQLGVEDRQINFKFYSNRALASFALRHYMAAISDCGIAMSLGTDMWQPYWTRSGAFEAIGEYNLAARVSSASSFALILMSSSTVFHSDHEHVLCCRLHALLFALLHIAFAGVNCLFAFAGMSPVKRTPLPCIAAAAI